MLVEDRDKAAQRSLLGAVPSGIRQGLGVADPLRLLQLDRARHRLARIIPFASARESPLYAALGQAVSARGYYGRAIAEPSPERLVGNNRAIRFVVAGCNAASSCLKKQHSITARRLA